ncbi:putative FAD-linked oxidoreductase [Polychaeton citri CBS 116435]|uniref:FAD-linked oxidoreductase n=1 Tax=Polychaeton citri CBS 116435 TaxID=1314669 RepID=A0A9P4UUR6_9PEZI|nr:putative FAD-linked oxidoreductase [Polychaeton citri CBS 116435]
MATIQGVKGNQFVKGNQDWVNNKYQYASSSYGIAHDMNPALIVQPADENDIILTLKHAKEKKIAVAIRTGGHQYSGASSTAAPNIQLDLQRTFQGPNDLVMLPPKDPDDGRRFVYSSVSHSLGEFNKFLGKNHVFVPHGQCTHVHVGGHVQTGGYGQLARSFGLFGDHVISLQIIDSDGNKKEVTKQSDSELFYAMLGGSPGNLGVITHFTLEVHRDQDHQGSRGLKAIYWYDKATLKRLISMVTEMAENPDFPRNYDLCVSVLSSSFPLRLLWPGLDSEIKEDHPEIFGDDGILAWPRSIIVYAQWVPFKKTDKPDMAWFDRVAEGSVHLLSNGVVERPMSQLTPQWLFRDVREFDLPYVKRTYLTNSTKLSKDWVPWVTDRIDEIVDPVDNFCWLSCQIQCIGGKQSMFTKNADNGTSYSWRDSTVCATMDCFHWSSVKWRADAWQKKNDEEGLGEHGKFSKHERRVLWGSYGEFDLDSVWQCYYEDREKYERLMKIRARADPHGIFTPNTFAVKRA